MTAPVEKRSAAEGAHHGAQRAIVRMLYDPAFAETVHADPLAAGLSPSVAALLGRTIDPRALRADPLRARRTLGELVQEFKASTVLALDEGRTIALLDAFFCSPEFHGAVEGDQPLVLAYGRYLAALCASGRLAGAWLPDVIALEEMQARARREAAPVAARVEGSPAPARVRLAPGVIFRSVTSGTLEVVRRVEELLFEQALVPGLGLAIDGPRLRLPERDPAASRLALLAVPVGGGLSLVTLDDELRALLEPLGDADELTSADAVERAVARGLGRARATELLVELLDQEVCAAAPQGSSG